MHPFRAFATMSIPLVRVAPLVTVAPTSVSGSACRAVRMLILRRGAALAVLYVQGQLPLHRQFAVGLDEIHTFGRRCERLSIPHSGFSPTSNGALRNMACR